MNISKSLKYYEDKARIDKAENQEVAHKIQIYANRKLDEYVRNYKNGIPIKPSQAELMVELGILNKPSVYKNYMRIINSPYIETNFLDKILLKNQAKKNLDEIVEYELERMVKNLDVIEEMMNEYDFVLSEYEDMVQQQEMESLESSNRYQILKNVIENYNDDIDSLKLPDGYHYHEIKYTAEHLHRLSQMKSKYDEVKFVNRKNEEKGIDARYVEKYWIHTHRGKTTRHMSNHMQHVPLDQPFIVVNDYTLDVDEMMYPCDPRGRPSNSYICYCEVEYRGLNGERYNDVLFSETTGSFDEGDSEISLSDFNDERNTSNRATYPTKVDEQEYFGVGKNNFNDKENEACKNFVDKFGEESIEHFQLIDEDGNVLMEASGDKHSVGWGGPKAIEKTMKSTGKLGGNFVNIHNHPTPFKDSKMNQQDMPTMLSNADIDRLFDVVTLGVDDEKSELYGRLVLNGVYAFKSVTATYGKDFRITLSRNEGGGLGENDLLENFNMNSEGYETSGEWIKSAYRMGSDYDVVKKEMNNVEGGWEELLSYMPSSISSHMKDWSERHAKDYNDIESFKSDYEKQRRQYVKHLLRDEEDNEFLVAVDKSNRKLNKIGYSLSVEWL